MGEPLQNPGTLRMAKRHPSFKGGRAEEAFRTASTPRIFAAWRNFDFQLLGRGFNLNP